MSGTRLSGTEVVHAFAEAMAQAGLPPPEHIKADGRLHRFPTNGHRADDAGYYILHLDGMPAGYFGCWRSGVAQAWHAERGHALTPAQRKAYRARVAVMARERDAEAARRQAEARVRAATIWKAAELDCGDHPYLVRKGINAYGVRRYRGELAIGGMSCDGALVVPARDGAGIIQTLQFLHGQARDGDNKRFLPGGVWKGHYFGIGKPNGTLCIAEGYATGASIHAATGQAVAIAFNAANLEPVARVLRNKFPEAKLLVCADNDLNEHSRPNAGVDAARRAAEAVGGVVAVPELEGRPCDFNDLCRARGPEAVKEALGTAQVVSNDEAQPESGSEQAFDREVERLAELHPRRYERERAGAAKRLKVRASVLDKLVRGAQRKPEVTGMGTEITFDEPAPSPQAVDGATLLEALTRSLHAHVKMSQAAGDATALWVVHTHAHAQARISPILCISSPEKRCGKSTLLAVLSAWVRRPLPASNISVSAIFRTAEKYAPTLLVDEADTFLKQNEELRGILNSGHTRDLAFVIRAVGDDFEPRRFSTWTPKAIALIGRLPPTLADRSLLIKLRRKLPGETVTKLKHADPALAALRPQVVRWVADNGERLGRIEPETPAGLHDRAADNWAPLLAIAELAGGEWPERARRAALELADGDLDEEVFAVQLLRDIRDVFEKQDVERLHSADLVEALLALEERPWAEWRQGRPLTANGLAKLLRAFGIKACDVRTGARVKKGYRREKLEDAFSRYLPPLPNATTLHPNSDAGPGDVENATKDSDVAFRDALKPSNDGGCSAVASAERGAMENESCCPTSKDEDRDELTL